VVRKSYLFSPTITYYHIANVPQNKTASAVQLKHLPTGLVVKCQATRSRDQNRKTARKILAEKLEVMELGEGSRTMIKAAEAARKKASKRKKAGRKYRKMQDGENEEEEGAVISEEGVESVGREKVESILDRSNRAEPP
jgi:peptide chain release factor